MDEYAVSRPTAAKAFRMLEEEGLVTRSPGLGTFVKGGPASTARTLLFGLAFPEFGQGEIFDPITSGISRLGKVGNFSLLWGTTKAKDEAFSIEDLLDLFDEYISRKVDGVFFAPLEGRDDTRGTSRQGLNRLSEAGIPVILIDRDLCLFPERSEYPLIAIDNIRAGYKVTEHLLAQGQRRADFVWLSYEAYTVELRHRGYRMALLDRGIKPEPAWTHNGDPDDKAFVESVIASGAHDVVCGNDETAARFMSVARDLGIGIPEEIRIAAFDDVRYSRLISVPLTTIRQPVEEIAKRAVGEMLGSLGQPLSHPASTILIDAHLIVRKSSFLPVEE
jgi:DNA-binding LacI/PurR family transcriptional regulator